MNKWLMIISLFAVPVQATDLVFNFNNPSFNGIGQSAHYLTIDEQEMTRKAAILEEIESKANDLLREQENTTLAKFVRNLESRIFSQLGLSLKYAYPLVPSAYVVQTSAPLNFMFYGFTCWMRECRFS
mgnify:CR=1 FL=1